MDWAAFSLFEPAIHPRGVAGRFVRGDSTARGEPTLCSSGHHYQIDEEPFHEAPGVPPVSTASVAKSLGLDLDQPAVRNLLAAASGAHRPADVVKFDACGGSQLRVRVESPGFRSEFLLRRPDPREAAQNGGKLVARMQLMRNDSSLSGHSGAEILGNVVRALRRAGASHLFLDAAGSQNDPDGLNGYYSWPRLGCEGEFSDRQLARLPPEWRRKLGRSRSVQDLFSLGGGDVWKRVGDHLFCWFDLAPGSRNTRNLERYLESKKQGYDPSADFSWAANLASFARRKGGWEPAPHAPGRVRRKRPGGKSYEYADARDVADEIPEARLVTPSGRIYPRNSIPYAEPVATQDLSIAGRLGSYARGRRLHAEIFGSREYDRLLAARAETTDATMALAARVRSQVKEVMAHVEQQGMPRIRALAQQGLIEREFGAAYAPGALARLEAADRALAREEERFRDYVFSRIEGNSPQYDLRSPGGLFYESVQPPRDTLEKTAEALNVAARLTTRLPGEVAVPRLIVSYVQADEIGNIDGGKRAAGYDTRLGVAILPSTGCPTSDMLHEIGHHLETHLPGASKACLAFWEHRRQGEPVRPINRRKAFGHLSDDCEGIEDRFDRAFGEKGVYVGRIYEGGPPMPKEFVESMRRQGFAVSRGPLPRQTEILSHGLEYLYQKPHRFEKDPEFFGFILGVLDGTLRDPPPSSR